MIQCLNKNKYKITIDCGIINGKRKRISRTIYGTKKDAKQEEHNLIYYVKNNQLKNDNKLTFNDLTNIYIKDYCSIAIRESTLYSYKNLLKKILNEIGNIQVDKIKTYDLQKFYNNLRQEHNYSNTTCAHYYTLIDSIFEKGIKWGLVNNNPNKLIDKPKRNRNETAIYNYEQLNKLLEVLEKEPIKYRAPIILCVDSGMRREELNGLQWNNIDFKTHEITINKTRIRVDKKVIISEPKTFKSNRKIMVSQITIDTLKELQDYQNSIKEKLGNNWNKENYLFVNDEGIPYYPDTLSKIFKRIIIKNKLDYITFHGLRHMCITMLIDNNVSISSVSERSGHSNTSTTLNVYSHAMEKSKKEMADVMDNILNKNQNNSKNATFYDTYA